MNLDRRKTFDYYVGGSLILAIKPIVTLLGRILHRDHDIQPRGRVVFTKMLGGGTLVIALPALLGLRRHLADQEFLLVTTPGVVPFARTLGIFDEILVIDDASPLALLRTGLAALGRTIGADTVIDLEVYSRLTTVFSILTGARNRVGFYLVSAFWRRGLHTHLVFFNPFSGAYRFYDKVAELFGAPISSTEDCRRHLEQRIATTVPELPIPAAQASQRSISIGHACSEMGRERMLSPAQWAQVVESRLQPDDAARIVLLGGPDDHSDAQEILAVLSETHPQLDLVNACGRLSLLESLSVLSASDEFWGIDSALLHYARLLGLNCSSWWGPTDPATRLRKLGIREEVHYQKIPCSPCIHVTEDPPCRGQNVCIHNLFVPKDEAREWIGLID